MPTYTLITFAKGDPITVEGVNANFQALAETIKALPVDNLQYKRFGVTFSFKKDTWNTVGPPFTLFTVAQNAWGLDGLRYLRMEISARYSAGAVVVPTGTLTAELRRAVAPTFAGDGLVDTVTLTNATTNETVPGSGVCFIAHADMTMIANAQYMRIVLSGTAFAGPPQETWNEIAVTCYFDHLIMP